MDVRQCGRGGKEVGKMEEESIRGDRESEIYDTKSEVGTGKGEMRWLEREHVVFL